MSRSILMAAALIVAGLFSGAAAAADLPGPILVPGALAVDGACASERVTGRIMARFDWAERRTWRRGFTMAALADPRPSGHPFVEPGIIERSYCMADATMSDGSMATVYYAIEYGQGFASLGNYVDFCVLGLDPWHVHDEACRTVR